MSLREIAGVWASWGYMGSCQNCGPFLGTSNTRCRTIIRTQTGTITFDNHLHALEEKFSAAAT